MLQDLLLPIHKLLHLLDKPGLDMGQSVNLIYGCPFSQGLIHDELPLRCGLPEQAHELG